MSTITITKLNPGDVASATDHNANVSAWEAATDTDMINQDNVREEGIDANNIDDESVEAFGDGTGVWFFESNSQSGALGTGVHPVLMGGATPVLLTGLDIAAGEEVIIRCSAWCQAAYPAVVSMILYYSNDGITFNAVGATRRPLHSLLLTMNQTYTVTHRHAYGAGTFHYALYCEDSTGANTYVNNAVLWAQMLRR